MIDRFIVQHPIVSEKATVESAVGKYMFRVHNNATKSAVRQAIEEIYKVTVIGIRAMNVKPKVRRLGRTTGVKPGYKKVIVTLAKGQKLDILPH